MRISTIIKNKFPTILSIVLLILLWKIISGLFSSEMIMPSPEVTLKHLFLIFQSKNFLQTVASTLIRGVIGFVISGTLGLIVGISAGMNKFGEKLVEPFLVTIKATPVMSIILITLIWFQSNHVPIFVSFLVAFPIICGNVLEGIKSVDVSIVQMAKIYHIPKWRILLEIYFPSIVSYLVAGFSTAMGIGWRAVIAAEVLSQPQYAIGTSLQTAKIYLETPNVFAWTLLAIFFSFLFEQGIRTLEKKIIRWR
ncbi:ABC transporter permease subunit [Clostridiaceae bacterium 35-E11]